MKFYYFAVGGIMLSLLTQSCNVEEVQCGDNGGEPIDCHNASGTYIGTFCSERDFPPCECYSTFGSSEKNNVDQFKHKDQCTTEGQYNFDGLPVTDPDPANPIGEPTANQPYEFTCALMGFDDICTEFEKYYFDLSQVSHDQDTRPIYVQFGIQSFDLENFEYRVSVSNPSVPYGNDIITFLLNETTLKSPSIRHIDIEDCPTGPCSAVVTIRMDVGSITDYPTDSDVVLSSVDLNSRERKQLATGTFKVETNILNFEERLFNLAIYKTDQLDMTQYRIGNQYFSEAILDVFGRGKSNIRFNVYGSEKLPEKYMVNALSEMVLETTDFIGTGNIGRPEVDNAIHQWSRRVTSNVTVKKRDLSPSKPDYGFSVEVDAVTVVDPLGNVDQQASTYATLGLLTARLGTTYFSDAFQDYYNASVIVRLNNQTLYNELESSTQQRINIEELELATFLHELGHMWSQAGYDATANGSCLKHTGKCTGLNYYKCLWRSACVASGSDTSSPSYDPNELSIDAYMLEKIRQPNFCEGHQQIFMNSLKPLE